MIEWCIQIVPEPRSAVPEFDSSSTDGVLIAATLAGEEEAFGVLVTRYGAALAKSAYSRLGQRELAEEVVQEALLCAHRWLSTYDSRYSFRTWLWTILLNQCARQGKREARHRSTFHDNSSALAVIPHDEAETTTAIDPSQHSPLHHLVAREACEQLHAMLSRLPDSQADALRLRFFGELTFPEIASAMNCSEAGAKHRVKTGLIKLTQWMSERDEQPAAFDELTTIRGQASASVSAGNGESL